MMRVLAPCARWFRSFVLAAGVIGLGTLSAAADDTKPVPGNQPPGAPKAGAGGGVLPGGGPLPRPGGGAMPGGKVMPNMPGALQGMRFGMQQEDPRLGASFAKPSDTLVSQLDLTRGQGMVLEKVPAQSPAGQAGIRSHDILLTIDGKMVPSDPEEFAKLVDSFKAKTPVDAVVLRKGKKEEVKGLSLPEVDANARKNTRPGGLRIGVGPGGRMPPGGGAAPAPGGGAGAAPNGGKIIPFQPAGGK